MTCLLLAPSPTVILKSAVNSAAVGLPTDAIFWGDAVTVSSLLFDVAVNIFDDIAYDWRTSAVVSSNLSPLVFDTVALLDMRLLLNTVVTREDVVIILERAVKSIDGIALTSNLDDGVISDVLINVWTIGFVLLVIDDDNLIYSSWCDDILTSAGVNDDSAFISALVLIWSSVTILLFFGSSCNRYFK